MIEIAEKDLNKKMDYAYFLGYNNAIDVFVAMYKSKTTMENELVDKIAEQLKRGGNDED